MRRSRTPPPSYRRSYKSQGKIWRILQWYHVPKCSRQVWSGHNCRQKPANKCKDKKITLKNNILFACSEHKPWKKYISVTKKKKVVFLREQLPLSSNGKFPVFDLCCPIRTAKGCSSQLSLIFPALLASRFRWRVQMIGEYSYDQTERSASANFLRNKAYVKAIAYK